MLAITMIKLHDNQMMSSLCELWGLFSAHKRELEPTGCDEIAEYCASQII